jgi:hypothetical protein
MALDIYVWLAQRLHRVPTSKPQFVDWDSLHEQFGQGFARNPAARANGTVRPSDMPITISRIASEAVNCFST